MIIKKTMLIVLNIFLIFISYIFLGDIKEFTNASQVAIVLLIINSIFIFMNTKKKITPINIIYICFVLFQFGLPLLYALDKSYTNWNIEFFSNENLCWCIKYTVICIEFFGLGILISSNKTKKEKKQNGFLLSDENSNTIYNVAKILLLIIGPIAFALAMYVVYLALIHGYNYIKTDDMGIYNSITRVCQQLIVPIFLLLIIYAPSKKQKKNYRILAFLYACILIFTGARTTSIALILVLLLLGKDDDSKKKKTIYIIIGIFLLMAVGTFIAQYRLYGDAKSFKISDVVYNVVEEMGFNFTSLPFTRLFIPTNTNFAYGKSYLYAIICLIPRTLDFTGLINSIHSYSPEIWLAKSLHQMYGSTFDYGVGYSVIAESYFNFGAFGFLSIFIQAIIINKILNIESKRKFSEYIKYIMLFSLITYPRRSFETLLKSIEYCIVLIVIIIYIFSYRKMHKSS